PRQSMLPELAPIQHAFSHFKLTLEFRHHRIRSTSSVQELDCRWLSPVQWLNEGIPRPIRQLLETLIADTQQPLPYTTTAPEPIENRP
ncbi:MAG: NUDIX domain-containing protein, partial [Pseudomonadota bacterium]